MIEFHGKRDGSLPSVGEMNADLVTEALGRLLGIDVRPADAEYGRSS